MRHLIDQYSPEAFVEAVMMEINPEAWRLAEHQRGSTVFSLPDLSALLISAVLLGGKQRSFCFYSPKNIYVLISWDFCLRIKNMGKENSGSSREGQFSSQAYSPISFCIKIRAFSIVS